GCDHVGPLKNTLPRGRALTMYSTTDCGAPRHSRSKADLKNWVLRRGHTLGVASGGDADCSDDRPSDDHATEGGFLGGLHSDGAQGKPAVGDRGRDRL